MITYRSVKGSKLTSNEVDANFQYLENRIGGDGNTITTQTGFTLVGQDLTINADWSWRILGISYTNAASVVVNIPFAASGNQRIDLIVANQSNTFERIAGIESVSNPTAPAIPSNKIVISFITVTDGTVGAPSDPILGTQFVKKTDNASYSFTDSGTNVELAIPANGASMLFLTNAALVSVSGFSLANITVNPSAEVPYNGKPFFIVNNTGVSIALNHDETATVPFFFIARADIVIPPSGIIELRYAADGISEVFTNFDNTKLSKSIAVYSDATLPLVGTEKLLLWDGVSWKKVSKSDINGSVKKTQSYSLIRDWVTTVLDKFYYINFSNNAIEFRPVGTQNTIVDSLTGRNVGMFTAPYNCNIVGWQVEMRNTGSFTGIFGIGSGQIASSLATDMTNKIVHLSQSITSAGYVTNQYSGAIVGGATILKGETVCVGFMFSAQAGGATKNGVTIQLHIEEV